MEMLRRLAHDLRDPTAFSPRSRLDRRTLAFVLSMLKTNAVTRRSLATMATTARCLAFLPRSYHVYTTLMAILGRSGPIFRRRRRAVGTPPRCDGGIRSLEVIHANCRPLNTRLIKYMYNITINSLAMLIYNFNLYIISINNCTCIKRIH